MKISILDQNIKLDSQLKQQLDLQLQFVSHALPKEGELKIILNKEADELFTLEARFRSRILDFQFKEASSSLSRLVARAPVALIHHYQSEHRQASQSILGMA